MRLHPVTSAILIAFSVCASSNADAQNYRTRIAATSVTPVISPNFIVHAPDPILARKVSREAERFRKELAIEWLGRELPNWNQKCPIKVEIGRQAGGETSFAFVMNGSGQGQPVDWQMKIFGPADRVLDAVLPHEVTHTIFATHFGQPLPRWADEGACTTVEHESERKKNHRMLLEFLSASPSRGLPFNRMFTMRNYPHDILPLYAQGYSLAKFLILQKGKRHFVGYIGKGLQNESKRQTLSAWNLATSEFYGYDDLSELQLGWIDWVRKGSNENAFKQSSAPFTVASADPPRSIPKLPRNDDAVSGPPPALNKSTGSVAIGTYANDPTKSWYVQQMKQGSNDRLALQRQDESPITMRKITTRESDPSLSVNGSALLPREFRPSQKTIWR